MNPDLAVLIPAWNERANLELLIPALREVLGKLGVAAEIIVIDGGSQDGTAERAGAWGVRVLRQKERGYGGALLTGFNATNASFIITMDADLSHPPVFIEPLWQRRADAEVLIASRYVPGGRAEMTRSRLLLSRILNHTFGWLLSMPVRDLSSGFRLYHRKVLASINPVARDFDFLQEVLIRVYSQGWRVAETPFDYAPRGAGQSHARLLRFGWGYSKTLWRMWRLRHARSSNAK
jgi:dolichol-phosphate mannosyltransferase